MELTLLLIGSISLMGWGTAHLFPTRNVVREFGEISRDNQNILRMEWINEGATLIFLGFLVLLVSLVDRTADISMLVYWSVFVFLNILSLISLFTGFRNNFIAFKLCPAIFSSASVLILLGGIVIG